MTVGLGAYAGFAAQVPVSAGAGPVVLGLFSSIVAGGGTYLGLLHERARRLPPPPRRGPDGQALKISVTFHPDDAAHARWLASAVTLATRTGAELRPWGSEPAVPGVEGEGWDLVVHSSTSEIAAGQGGPWRGGEDGGEDGGEGARRVAVRVDRYAERSVPPPARVIDLAGRAEGTAYATLVRGLVACGAIEAGDAAASRPLPSECGVRFPGDGPRVTNLGPSDWAFLERDDLTRRVRAGLVREHAHDRARAVALWGLGGAGKSSAAAHYAHRFGGTYDIVWWLNAEGPVELRHGLLNLAAELGVREQPDADRVIAELWRALRGRERWLLIYDNADADAVPAGAGDSLHCWPAGRDGHVLFTSARPDWAGLIEPEHCLEVRPMTPETAERLLCTRTGDRDGAAAREIARVLGGLPLALDHAAAYCLLSGVPLRTYRRLLDDSLGELLSRFRPGDRVRPVSMTWNLLLTRAGEHTPGTLDLMRLWSMLAPVRIPRDLLDASGPPLPGELAALADGPIAHDMAVQRLAMYSLIKAEAGHVHVHRLVQAAVRLEMGPDAAAGWLETAAVLLAARFPLDVQDSARWPACAALLPHVMALQARYREHCRAAAAHPGIEEVLGGLLHRAGCYLIERSSYREAREPVETALALRERAHGRGSPQWAETELRLGILLYRLADLAGARTAVGTALRVREETAGPDDPALCPFLAWRCRVLIEFSELAEARRAADRAHRILTAAGVPDDDDRRIENDDQRATVLWRGGGFRAAVRIMERSVAALRRAYGDDDDRTLVASGRLAFLEGELAQPLGDQAMLRAARDRVAASAETLARRYGDEHFEVAQQRRTLAAVLCALGEFAEAERLLRLAAGAYRETLGEHPSTVAAEKLHAVALARLGEFERADEILRRCRALYERVYGPSHPYVAEVLVEHGPVLADHGDVDGAARALDHARRIYEERYGPGHPKLIPVLTGLAALPGPPDETTALRERAARIRDDL